MQPETRIVKSIGKLLDSMPRCWYFKVHGGPYQAAGIPDIVGVANGHFFGIEVKVPGKKPTILQELVMRRIGEAGGIVGWVTTPSEVVDILGVARLD